MCAAILDALAIAVGGAPVGVGPAFLREVIVKTLLVAYLAGFPTM